MRGKIFAVLLIAILLIAARDAPGAEAVSFNPNWRSQPSAAVITGRSAMYWYNGGPDTLRPSALADSAWGDSVIYTDWLQVQWGENYSTTLPPNYSISDSITAADAKNFDLWVNIDSCTVVPEDSSVIYWVNGDSSCLSKISFEFMIDDSTVCTWADSSGLFVQAGNYDHADYGAWRWLPPASAVAPPGVWVCYSVRLPMCEAVRFRYEADETIREIAVINWRFVCKN